MLAAVTWEKMGTEQMNEKITREMISGQDATVARVILSRGAIVPRHSHRSEQYTMIVAGALKFVFDDGEMVVHPGEVLLIPAHLPHAAEALEDTIDIDFFAPPRQDWITKNDSYLRQSAARE